MNARIAIFLSWASIMMTSIFIPGYSLAIGASMTELGLIGAGYGISLFISSYLFSRASELKGRKYFIVLGLILSSIAFFVPIVITTPIQLILARSLAGFALGVFTAPLIAYAQESGEKMGAFSSYGSLGWAVGGLIAGIIAQKGEALTHLSPLVPYWSVFLMSSLFFFASYLTTRKLLDTGFTPRALPLLPSGLFFKNLRVYVSAFLRYFGAYSIWIIFPLFLSELGANNLWIGILYFINMGGQAVIMRKLDVFNEVKLIKGGLILSAAVFLTYTFAPNYLWIIPLQILLALSYSFLYVGDLIYLTNHNEEKAASVGILNSILGICIGIGPFFGGIVSEIYGFKAVMYSASFLAFLGFVIMGRK